VICVDSSQPALDAARVNADANQIGDRIEFVRSDVFKYLEQAKARGDQFDVVVLDPPKMARSQSGFDQAMRGYHSLNAMSASLLRSGGILVTCSCSGRVSREDFELMLANVATSLRRPIQILESRGQPPDHPVSPNCPENSYLKCYICRVA
jgi:23S rRNA (cytosine1962-C5)-methyltransferase